MKIKHQKAVIVLFAFLAILFSLLTALRNTNKTVQILIHSTNTVAIPRVLDLSRQTNGSYWDDPALSLPCLHGNPGDTVTLLFQPNLPPEASIIQHEIFDETIPLGTPKSRSAGKTLQINQSNSGNEISFIMERTDSGYQLIRCCCIWRFLFFEREIEYAFVLLTEAPTD